MGRESYGSEDEVRGAASKLREERIPCDVKAGEVHNGQDGAAILHVRLAQSTAWVDRGGIELAVFGAGAPAERILCLPEEGVLHALRLERENGGFVLKK